MRPAAVDKEVKYAGAVALEIRAVVSDTNPTSLSLRRATLLLTQQKEPNVSSVWLSNGLGGTGGHPYRRFW